MRCPETEVVQHLDRLFRFGRVLDDACKERGLLVTSAELHSHLVEQAKKLNMTPAQFERLLVDQRGIALEDYRENALYTEIALKKLAGESQEEQRLFFERLRLFANVWVFFGDKPASPSGQPSAERSADRDRRLDDLERKVDLILQRLEGAGRRGTVEPLTRIGGRHRV